MYAGTISINNTALDQQPTELDETPTYVYGDQTAISGAKERQTFGSKKAVEMTWEFASPATVRLWMGYANAGEAVTYKNSNSAFYNGQNSFTGIVTVKQNKYERGGSGFSKLTVTIEEGSGYLV